MNPSGYSAAARTVAWLLTDLETALERVRPGAVIDNGFVRSACERRVPSLDEISVAVNGLVEVGILQPASRGYAFDAQRFVSTREYRRGFRDGLAAVPSANDSTISLCMAVPPDLPQEFKERIADAAADLRASIVNVITAATYRLVLASPFWDVTTVSDIGELARRRVEAGVRLDVLGRSNAEDDAMSHLNQLFAGLQGVRVFRWYDPVRTREAVTTFHFKAVVADDGARAYVGTANLTRSSLRSTMELGFIVGGAQGRAVARIIDSVIGISERVGP